jgi:AcrR family transcriptional regulator
VNTADATVAGPRGGRPRSEEATRAILDAALQEFVASGYGAMTIDRVATRSGVGKATIYRRWSTKAELVAEAIDRHTFSELPIEDTGDVRRDLHRYLRGIENAMSGLDGDLMVAMIADRLRHPDLAVAFDRRFVLARRDRVQRLLRHAVERGELPVTTDVEILADAGPGLFLLRLATGRRGRTAGLADRMVVQLLGPDPAPPPGRRSRGRGV